MTDSSDNDRRARARGGRHVALPWFTPLPQANEPLTPLPEVNLLLDDCGRIVRQSGRYAGERLRKITFTEGATPHDVLHPGCDGDDCDFYADWLIAWESRESGLPVEWLFHFRATDTLLRFRLQPVSYTCSVLFDEALHGFEGQSLLSIQDMSASLTQLKRKTRSHDERADPATAYQLRRATDPDPHVIASLDKRLRTVTSRLLVSHETERKRIARELHDSLGQSLSLLRFEIEACMSRTAADGGSVDRRLLDRSLSLTKQALGELRSIAQNLRPTVINDHGLFGALEVLCDDFRVVCPDVELTLDLSGCANSVPDELSIAVYRIAQEGLNNIAQHADASKALLRFSNASHGVELTISDNGVGLPAEGATRGGLGLITMRERTEILGGNYSISGIAGAGCTVTLSWPTDVLESMR